MVRIVETSMIGRLIPYRRRRYPGPRRKTSATDLSFTSADQLFTADAAFVVQRNPPTRRSYIARDGFQRTLPKAARL